MTTIFVRDLKSFELAINIFSKFERISDLKLNLEKCEIIEVRPMKRLQSDILKQLDKKGKKGSFKTLGVWFAKDHKQRKELNFDECLKNKRKTKKNLK